MDLQQAQMIQQLREMNIMEEGRERPAELQQTGGADSGFNSDKVRNNGLDQSAGGLEFYRYRKT